MIWKPHATVAAIIHRDGKYLLVEEDSDGEIVFNQPAGHLDPNESLVDAVIRETREETAWGFIPDAITGIYRWIHPGFDRTYLRFAFCGQIRDFHNEQPLDDGILRTVWLSRDEVQARQDRLRSPMVLRCIDDFERGHRYPLEMLFDL